MRLVLEYVKILAKEMENLGDYVLCGLAVAEAHFGNSPKKIFSVLNCIPTPASSFPVPQLLQ